MQVESIIFFGFVFVIIVLSLTLLGISFSYIKTLIELGREKEEKDKLRENANKKAAVILEQARDKAGEIINQAGGKVSQILADTQSLDNQTKLLIKEQLDNAVKLQVGELAKASQELLGEYKIQIEDLKKEDVNLFKNISKDIERDAMLEVEDFKELLKKETLDSQKIVEAKIEQEYQSVQKDVKLYKETEIKRIDDSIYKIIEQVSQMVMGEAISLDKHQELVIEALKKAKSELSLA